MQYKYILASRFKMLMYKTYNISIYDDIIATIMYLTDLVKLLYVCNRSGLPLYRLLTNKLFEILYTLSRSHGFVATLGNKTVLAIVNQYLIFFQASIFGYKTGIVSYKN